MAEAAGVTPRADDTWSDIFSKVLTALIEPKLGNGRATLLTEYPASESGAGAAAPRTTRASPSASSSTAAGSSSPTAFGELTDADVQRRRLEAEMDKKEARYGERYPLDEDFLAALARCRRRRAVPSASTASSCWRQARRASTR